MTNAEVTITVGKRYVSVAGGWTGMRPVGLRREYRAAVDGLTFVNTSKTEIMQLIRQHFYRSTGSNRVRFNLLEQQS